MRLYLNIFKIKITGLNIMEKQHPSKPTLIKPLPILGKDVLVKPSTTFSFPTRF